MSDHEAQDRRHLVLVIGRAREALQIPVTHLVSAYGLEGVEAPTAA